MLRRSEIIMQCRQWDEILQLVQPPPPLVNTWSLMKLIIIPTLWEIFLLVVGAAVASSGIHISFHHSHRSGTIHKVLMIALLSSILIVSFPHFLSFELKEKAPVARTTTTIQQLQLHPLFHRQKTGILMDSLAVKSEIRAAKMIYSQWKETVSEKIINVFLSVLSKARAREKL